MTHHTVTKKADSFWCAPKLGRLLEDSMDLTILLLALQPRLIRVTYHSMSSAEPKSGQFSVRTRGEKDPL